MVGLMGGEIEYWGGLCVVLGLLLFLELGVFHRKPRVLSLKKEVAWSGFWIGISLGIGGLITWGKGLQAGMEFFTGYFLEKLLSFDNLLVFAFLFSFFQIPLCYQRRVLYAGIGGAALLRFAFIFIGIELIEKVWWIHYLLALGLYGAGWQLFFAKEKNVQGEGYAVKLCRKFLPISENTAGGAFFIREGGRYKGTSLLLALIAIETTDLFFALDSLPAIFAVTRDPFIVYSSNLCALLGLKSLYFVLVHFLGRCRYLGRGLGLLLFFIATVMGGKEWFTVPTGAMLAIVVSVVGISIGWSLRGEKRAV